MKQLQKLILILPIVAAPLFASDVAAQDKYRVVVNHEEQYLIWPTDREIPEGWKDTDRGGTLDECREYIEEVWTDMRPLSVRKKAEELELKPGGNDYKVVVNEEEQHAIWLVNQKMSGSWKEALKAGTLKECTEYIEEVWTDMRPISLRKKVE